MNINMASEMVPSGYPRGIIVDKIEINRPPTPPPLDINFYTSASSNLVLSQETMMCTNYMKGVKQIEAIWGYYIYENR